MLQSWEHTYVQLGLQRGAGKAAVHQTGSLNLDCWHVLPIQRYVAGADTQCDYGANSPCWQKWQA